MLSIVRYMLTLAKPLLNGEIRCNDYPGLISGSTPQAIWWWKR
nr:MAG TPA: hypothetical protein [Bacteriophage sp.]